MSKERELLKEIMTYFAKGDITIRKFENDSDIAEALHNAQELLSQPEQTKQEPVAWRYHYSVNDSYTIFQQYPQGLVDAGKIIEPLYTATKI
jgi:hypothetical protein